MLHRGCNDIRRHVGSTCKKHMDIVKASSSNTPFTYITKQGTSEEEDATSRAFSVSDLHRRLFSRLITIFHTHRSNIYEIINI